MHNPKTRIRLNIGCGGRPLRGYVNIDMDNLDQIKERYPNQTFEDDLVVKQYDIFNLPYETASVDEILCDGVIEHLSFMEEPCFFHEMYRCLKFGGIFCVSTVDFEKTVREWLDAPDDWKDFFRNDLHAINTQHWFGTGTYERVNRWGYLTAVLYGTQNGEGQYHKNCYTEGKLRAIFHKIGMETLSVEHFQWKGDRDHMLRFTVTKPV